jgi:hypothetical protein
MALLPKIMCVIQNERSICVTESIKFSNIGYIKVSFGVNKQIYIIYTYINIYIYVYVYIRTRRDIYNLLKMKKEYVTPDNVSKCGSTNKSDNK